MRQEDRVLGGRGQSDNGSGTGGARVRTLWQSAGWGWGDRTEELTFEQA